jgi:hypothetical protein
MLSRISALENGAPVRVAAQPLQSSKASSNPKSTEQVSQKPEATQRRKAIVDDDDDMFFDIGMARLNLCSCIENLEWKVDLKLLYTIKYS